MKVHLEGVNRCNANQIGYNMEMQQLIKEWCKESTQIKKWSQIPYERALELLLYIPLNNELRCSIVFLIERVKNRQVEMMLVMSTKC